ncbi:MAG: hypothetical protein IPK13_12770 [Deltaproteobacteria bacterium]|nr:hypothetical protein [Deltaproteobacteria bacterium]
MKTLNWVLALLLLSAMFLGSIILGGCASSGPRDPSTLPGGPMPSLPDGKVVTELPTPAASGKTATSTPARALVR